MSRVDELPMRVGAVIETVNGVLLVKELKNSFRDKQVPEINKMNKSEKQKECGRHLARGPYSLPGGTVEPNEYYRETLQRELLEELDAPADISDMYPLMYIEGKERRQILYSARIENVFLQFYEQTPEDKKAIIGIGFLKQRNIIPLTRHFFQPHVGILNERYIRHNHEVREEIRRHNLSTRLNMHLDYAKEWFREETLGFAFHSPKYIRKANIPSPVLINSVPDFLLFPDNFLNPLRHCAINTPQEIEIGRIKLRNRKSLLTRDTEKTEDIQESLRQQINETLPPDVLEAQQLSKEIETIRQKNREDISACLIKVFYGSWASPNMIPQPI